MPAVVGEFEDIRGWAFLKRSVPDAILRNLILAPFAELVATGESLGWIFEKCARICAYYDVDTDQRRMIARTKTKDLTKKLKNIATTTKRLQSLLKDNHLLGALAMGPHDDALYGKFLVDTFSTIEVRHMLNRIAKSSELMQTDDDYLNWSRGDYDRKWSVERSFIWEPYFELVVDYAGELPKSRNGPVINAIKALHVAVSANSDNGKLAEPSVESIYTAIREFNARKVATGEK